MELSTLFSPAKIGNVQIKNRIIRSATSERLANKDGTLNEQYINFYKKLANGGTGLIITGFITVELGYSVIPNSPALFDDSHIPSQKLLIKTVHNTSDVKICAQLGHTGRQTSHPKFEAVGPSAIADKRINRIPHELSEKELQEKIKKFVNAGIRAFDCGYDMIQLHAAHGYLLSNFISPYSNNRLGEYGGDTYRRTKIILDIFDQIKDYTGKNFPIIIKLNTEDGVPEGMDISEGKNVAKLIIDKGFDAIEVSGGTGESLLSKDRQIPSISNLKPEDENYFLPNLNEIKPIMGNCAAILMGGIKNPLKVESLLKEGSIDFIAMCRPLIYEPNLPNRWLSGDLSPAKCKSCNNCYMSVATKSIFCAVRRREEKKKLRADKNK
jgi:2,4-dienoyl-CoA reductase-like NADH-dependent reductase (Old Yellow Enzyme family)